MIDNDECGAIGGMRIGKGSRSTQRKPATTNPTCPDLGSNPGHRCGNPATNPLSYGTALDEAKFISRLGTVESTFQLCSPVIKERRYKGR
jgi:hypothetical protein